MVLTEQLTYAEFDGTTKRFVVGFLPYTGSIPTLPPAGETVDQMTAEQIALAYQAAGAPYVIVQSYWTVNGTGQNAGIIYSYSGNFVCEQDNIPTYVPPVPGGPVQSIAIQGSTTFSMNVGALLQLSAIVLYTNGATQTVTAGNWTSDNPAILLADEYGHIEALVDGGPVHVTLTVNGTTSSPITVTVVN